MNVLRLAKPAPPRSQQPPTIRAETRDSNRSAETTGHAETQDLPSLGAGADHTSAGDNA
jgi:hypothetical protein